MSQLQVPLGIDYYEAISTSCYYVDKTNIIETISNSPLGTCLLFTRPPRFGKTLMISMLQTFFEQNEEDKSRFFIDKQIWKNKEIIEKEFQKYPLIHLNLKNVIGTDYDTLVNKLKEYMRKEYQRHMSILDLNILNKYDVAYYNSILASTESVSDLTSSLARLSEFIYQAYKKHVIILIDEYDTPVHYAYDNGYYDEAIILFKQLFGESLKSNPVIRFAVLTGILQIAKESLFSGVNNLVTNSILSKNMDEAFGFNEREVKEILKYYNLSDKYETANEWYGGYRFGNSIIFNPLSILNFVQNDGETAPYWSNTGESRTLAKLLTPDNVNLLLPLMSDENIETEVDIAISYKDLDDSFISTCSYLLSSGYLAIKNVYEATYELNLPNKEIKQVFKKEVRGRYISSAQLPVAMKIKRAFENGDINSLEKLIENYLLSSMSSFKLKNEKNYQIILGTALSIIFENAYVKNEFKAGQGRADLVVIPKNDNKLGFVLETKYLKWRTGKDRLIESAKDALNQIKIKEYDQELIKLGIKNILLFGVSFSMGKIAIQCEQKKGN